MLLLSLISLAIAFGAALWAIALVAVYISLKVTDEILQLTIALIALFCLFLSLVFLPWPVELLMVMALWVAHKHSNALAQAYVGTTEGETFPCLFPLAFAIAQGEPLNAIANRCEINPTDALERVGKRQIRRRCMRTCRYAFRREP